MRSCTRNIRIVQSINSPRDLVLEILICSRRTRETKKLARGETLEEVSSSSFHHPSPHHNQLEQRNDGLSHKFKIRDFFNTSFKPFATQFLTLSSLTLLIDSMMSGTTWNDRPFSNFWSSNFLYYDLTREK